LSIKWIRTITEVIEACSSSKFSLNPCTIE
jgi:hypothetical protein